MFVSFFVFCFNYNKHSHKIQHPSEVAKREQKNVLSRNIMEPAGEIKTVERMNEEEGAERKKKKEKKKERAFTF